MPIKRKAKNLGSPEGDAQRPELVFGLVGPLGTDLSLVSELLREALMQVRYKVTPHRLSRLMRELNVEPWKSLRDGPRDDEIGAHMDAGNELRNRTGRKDALAMLGVGAIRACREELGGDANRPLSAHAHILQSLKRREEIDCLRRVYGPTFYVLASYSPREQRVRDLAKKISESRHANQIGEYRAKAEELLSRDEAEAENPFGQDTRATFAMADVFVNSSDRKATKAEIQRFIELLFGYTFHTPTREEEGIHLAYLAACRSASLARQVGAAVCREDGSVVAIGTNEVARPGGGQYWCHDAGDGRDFHDGKDGSDSMRENVLRDILKRLSKAGWLAKDRAAESIESLARKALHESQEPIMKSALFTSTIDFVRAVHAEMAAITTAARHGVSVQGCTLFTTTFPCHDCAKHIVASGIKKVVYVEPYPKSLVPELYSDSVVIDASNERPARVRFDPFVGIAPRRYWDLFALSKRKRKEPGGTMISWSASSAKPSLPDHVPPPLATLITEAEEIKGFETILDKTGIRKLAS